MSKKRGYRADVTIVDEVIPEEVKEEVVEEVVLMGPIAVKEEVEPTKPVYTVKSAATVIAFRLNVRENPALDSNILKVLNFKDDVEILDESTTNGWVSVLCSDGTKGYCMSKFIKTIK